MIKPISLLVSAGVLALSVGACSQRGEQAQQTPPPSPSPSPAATPAKPFESSMQPGMQASPPAVANLIPSTNPTQQRAQIAKGRQDPFAVIPVQPIVKNTTLKNTTLKNTTLKNTTLKNTTLKNSSRGDDSTGPGFRGGNRVGPTPTTTPPPPLTPTEAKAVEVSGVVNLGGRPVAIVQAPGEAVARSVIPGMTLANGKVLVKAINTRLETPVVILEQYGIQVTRPLGAKPEAPVPVSSPSDSTLPPAPPQSSLQISSVLVPSNSSGLDRVKNFRQVDGGF